MTHLKCFECFVLNLDSKPDTFESVMTYLNVSYLVKLSKRNCQSNNQTVKQVKLYNVERQELYASGLNDVTKLVSYLFSPQLAFPIQQYLVEFSSLPYSVQTQFEVKLPTC